MTTPAADLQATESRPLVVERTLLHTQESIWRALTDGSLLTQWLLKNDFEPEVGRRFTFRADTMPQWSGVIRGQVLVVEPKSKLSYSWDVSGNAAAGGFQTVVTWTLTPVAGGVLLRMEQTGFCASQIANAEGAAYGWQLFLGNLERLLPALALSSALPSLPQGECP